jgi:hypothetical protein
VSRPRPDCAICPTLLPQRGEHICVHCEFDIGWRSPRPDAAAEEGEPEAELGEESSAS